jgi:hypothetical protein
MTTTAQTACRATERQRPAPAGNPQPRTKFSGQRDRPGEKAKLAQLGPKLVGSPRNEYPCRRRSGAVRRMERQNLAPPDAVKR